MNRLLEEFVLGVRYAFRRLGLSGYQIHQIILKEQGLIYIPIPKNACSSMKDSLYLLEFGHEFDTNLPKLKQYKSHHDYFLKRANAFTGKYQLNQKKDYTRIAIIREPIERFISCYRNRVIDLEDLAHDINELRIAGLEVKPDINSFVKKLEVYRSVNKAINHHTTPQSNFLGHTIEYLDRIYTLADIEELQQLLQSYKPDLKFYKRKSGGTSVKLGELSRESLHKLFDFYAEDYNLFSKYFSPEDIFQELKKIN
ncbi:MAG: sulfotransferase family 2 domain-containing protein [Gracilimonas sp.]